MISCRKNGDLTDRKNKQQTFSHILNHEFRWEVFLWKKEPGSELPGWRMQGESGPRQKWCLDENQVVMIRYGASDD